ncbi:DUF6225 family protein [Kitasatospora sp. NPDC052868]|uniref:DUF6225 family protein n=1 Tax=Kitasatospora sp. NPDC052868 TaxID=3364060 RepID=UPI0037C5A914
MTERAAPYHHTVDAWTVGRLREALAGLPDGMPIALALPGDGRPAALGGTFDDEWVITGTEHLVTRWGGEGGERIQDHLTIVVDRPTGVWELREGERLPQRRRRC